jgi:type II secretion system protein I
MKGSRGFTLLEVLVALVIVAFGMSAVMAALSSSAGNIGALRTRTFAEWVAMNQIADARLNFNAPKTGSTEGDVKDFGGADWHWRQDVVAVEMIPGMLEIAVRVKQLPKGSSSTSTSSSSGSRSSSGGSSRGSNGSSNSSSGAPGSFFGASSSGLSGAFGSSGGASSGASSGFHSSSSSGLGLVSSSGVLSKNIGASKLPATADDQHWIATVIGFRGDAVAASTGEIPDWSPGNSSTTESSGSGSSGTIASPAVSSSSSGATSSPTSPTTSTSPQG